MKKEFMKITSVIIGLILVAFAFNIFLLPNDLVAIGITGLAILFEKLYNIPISIFVLIGNILLVIASYIVLDKLTTRRSIIGSLLIPIILNLTLPIVRLIDLSEVELIIQVVIGASLSGIGYGLIFKQGYSSGGTDIANQIMSHIYKIPINKAILIIDGMIVCLGGLVFGLEKMIYSILALVIISFFTNKEQNSVGMNKILYIYTKKPAQVKNYIVNVTKNDVSILDAEGKNENRHKKILMTVITNTEYYKIKSGILEIDKNSFIVASTSHELINNNKKIRNT